MTTMSVSWSMPRAWTSSISAETDWSSTGRRIFICSKMFQTLAWSSQENAFWPGTQGKSTVTSRTPASTSRRASRQRWPIALRP